MERQSTGTPSDDDLGTKGKLPSLMTLEQRERLLSDRAAKLFPGWSPMLEPFLTRLVHDREWEGDVGRQVADIFFPAVYVDEFLAWLVGDADNLDCLGEVFG